MRLALAAGRFASAAACCLLPFLAPEVQAQNPDSSSEHPAAPAYAITLTGGRAFMLDLDDADPAGSLSLSASIERRRRARSLSIGVEGGFHRFLIIDQHLEPDVTGWANTLEDRRQAWRVTPFVRWRTRGDVSFSAQVGAGLYVQRSTYFQKDREAGEVVYETRRAATDAGAGLNLGVGLEIAPGSIPFGLVLGLRSHAVVAGGGNGFNTAEIGIVWHGRR